MDANGLRFWMLANEADWVPASMPDWQPDKDGPDVYYDSAWRSLRLASYSSRMQGLPVASLATASAKLDQVPGTRDAYGTPAYWDPDRKQVMATGALPGALPIFTPPANEQPSDMTMGYDGMLYLAMAPSGQSSCRTAATAGTRYRWPCPISPPGAWPPTRQAGCGPLTNNAGRSHGWKANRWPSGPMRPTPQEHSDHSPRTRSRPTLPSLTSRCAASTSVSWDWRAVRMAGWLC